MASATTTTTTGPTEIGTVIEARSAGKLSEMDLFLVDSGYEATLYEMI